MSTSDTSNGSHRELGPGKHDMYCQGSPHVQARSADAAISTVPHQATGVFTLRMTPARVGLDTYYWQTGGTFRSESEVRASGFQPIFGLSRYRNTAVQSYSQIRDHTQLLLPNLL